jgi:hypothetical protein
MGILMHSSQWGFQDFISVLTTNPDFFHILFSVVLPFFLTCVLLHLKTNQKYSLGGVLELCEFGMPFASIVSMLVISCTYNLLDTTEQHLSTYITSNMVWTIMISPLFVFIAILLTVRAIIHKHTVDVLISVTMAWGTVNIVNHDRNILLQTSMWGAQSSTGIVEYDVATLILGIVAFGIRLVLTTNLVSPPASSADYPMNSVTIPLSDTNNHTSKKNKKQKKDTPMDLENIEEEALV